MNLLKNNQQKLDDIIFANRNKNYGAYAIRSAYDGSVIKSLLIVFSTTMLFALGAYILNRPHTEETTSLIDSNNLVDSLRVIKMNIEDPFKKKVIVAPPAKPTGGTKGETQSTKVVDSVAVETATVLNSSSVSTGTSAITSTNTGIPNTNTITSSAGGGSISTGDEGPTLTPDEAPEFEGGLSAIRNFISRNVSYPEKAKINEREGVVRVSFVVNESGNVVDVKVEDGIGSGCDEEAARVISKLPKFKKPGKVAGKPVKVLFYIPIKFRLQQ